VKQIDKVLNVRSSVARESAQIGTSLRASCLHTALCAIRSLHAELVLYPKPGLVSLVDNGSHADMDAAMFMRSLFSLRHYFIQMAQAGAQDASFDVLKKYGMQAERRMLIATNGINTHRGAIFSLGMLSAAAGYCHARSLPLAANNLRRVLMQQWGAALQAHANPAVAKLSNGLRATHLYAVNGARAEGAQGFPAVFEIGLPQLLKSLARGAQTSHAQVDTLFSLMAQMTDTNIYHRGGADAAAMVSHTAGKFMQLGGTSQTDWQSRALECHHLFVSHNLSPGGAADMLSASWFVYQLTQTVE
jgi:triphosphoribosyl-dephospho-CoA synthase